MEDYYNQEDLLGQVDEKQQELDIEKEFEKELLEEAGNELRRNYVYKLKWRVMNEKNSPEILTYDKELIENIQEKIKATQELIDSGNDTKDAGFESKIYQMEVDRIKYLVASYFRVRLYKIQKHVLFILKDSNIYSKLSYQEYEFAKKFLDLKVKHYRETILNKLPAPFSSAVGKGDANTGEQENMIEEPNVNEFVMFRALKDIGQVNVDEQVIFLEKNDCYALKYDAIRGFVEDGELCLL